MRHFACLLAMIAWTGAASASCYTVVDGQNRIVHRSSISPVDLSAPISQGMAARYPGHFLIVAPDDAGCAEIDREVGVREPANSNFTQTASAPGSAVLGDSLFPATAAGRAERSTSGNVPAVRAAPRAR